MYKGQGRKATTETTEDGHILRCTGLDPGRGHPTIHPATTVVPTVRLR